MPRDPKPHNPISSPKPQASSLSASTLRRRSGLAAIRVYANLGSTQTRAAELVETRQLQLPAAIVASRQTAGRGQSTNTWWSDSGSLTVTFVFPAFEAASTSASQFSNPKSEISNPKFPLAPPSMLSLRVGLILRTAIASHVDSSRLQIKWPNDLLADGRKLAGILCEQVRGINLIGIGLNVGADLSRAPVEVRRRATSILDLTGHAPSRADLFVDIAIALREGLAEATASPGWHEELNRVHVLNGRPIAVDTGGQAVLRGICMGIDPAGRLLVQENATLHKLISGRIAEW